MRSFFTSLAFLSRLPVPTSWQLPGDADFRSLPRWFWFAGLVLGALLGLIAWGLAHVFPPMLAAVCLIGFGVVLTGAFHEDGFADVADACGGYTRERRFEIMHDSRLGTFGVSALIFLFLFRFVAFSHVMIEDIMRLAVGLALLGGWSRWTAVLLMQLLPYLDSTGKGIARHVRPPGWIMIILSGTLLFGLSAWADLALAVGLAVGALLVAGLARLIFQRFLGGITGDGLGATAITTEIVGLALLVTLS